MGSVQCCQRRSDCTVSEQSKLLTREVVSEREVSAPVVTKPEISGSSSSSSCSLKIIHINDVYLLDHLPRVKSCVDSYRAKYTNVLVTLAGDFLGPSLLSSIDHGTGIVDCLNKVGVDVICFGNHECDVPYEALEQRIEEFRGVWLNSNMPGFVPDLPCSHVIDLASDDGCVAMRKVGFLGFLIGGGNFAATYRENAFGGYAEDIVPVLEAYEDVVAALRADHPDVDAIVPLTHQDQAEDEIMAGKGVFPVILGGHDHEVTCNRIAGCSVVKAGSDAEVIAIVDLTWEADKPRGASPCVNVEFIEMKRFPEDAALSALKDQWMAPVRELETATIARISQSLAEQLPNGMLSSKDARFGECSMAGFLASALRSCLHADAAFINAGAVRGECEYSSDITYADLKKECPFPSQNVVIDIRGRTLSEAIGVSRKPWLHPDGPQEASQALHADSNCRVEVRDNAYELTIVNSEPLDLEKMYSVVFDTYDIKKNPVLRKWAEDCPEKVPPPDVGRPTLPILVEHFSNEMWYTLVASEDGQCGLGDVAAFLAEADADGDGLLSLEELTAALSKRLGVGASAIVAQCMMNIADSKKTGMASPEDINAVFGIETRPRKDRRISTAGLSIALLSRSTSAASTVLRPPVLKRGKSAPAGKTCKAEDLIDSYDEPLVSARPRTKSRLSTQPATKSQDMFDSFGSEPDTIEDPLDSFNSDVKLC